MPRQRSHNEYFRTVSLGNRKTCPSCSARLSPGKSIWSWGEYVCGKWRTVSHFCQSCWSDIASQLNGHKLDCGCTVSLVGYHGQKLPAWLTLATQTAECASPTAG